MAAEFSFDPEGIRVVRDGFKNAGNDFRENIQKQKVNNEALRKGWQSSTSATLLDEIDKITEELMPDIDKVDSISEEFGKFANNIEDSQGENMQHVRRYGGDL